ncbi:MAG: hypothetical protein HYU97_02560 [Deltaproteobacteria bacterium]|nr:hypothetical protein [Deltaproteobacteria bacterium]
MSVPAASKGEASANIETLFNVTESPILEPEVTAAVVGGELTLIPFDSDTFTARADSLVVSTDGVAREMPGLWREQWDDLLWAVAPVAPLLGPIVAMMEQAFSQTQIGIYLGGEDIPELARVMIFRGLALYTKAQLDLELARGTDQYQPKVLRLWRDYLSHSADGRMTPLELTSLLYQLHQAPSRDELASIDEDLSGLSTAIGEFVEDYERKGRQDARLAVLKGWLVQINMGWVHYCDLMDHDMDTQNAWVFSYRVSQDSFAVAQLWLKLGEWDEARVALHETVRINQAFSSRLEKSGTPEAKKNFTDELARTIAKASQWLDAVDVLSVDWDQQALRLIKKIQETRRAEMWERENDVNLLRGRLKAILAVGEFLGPKATADYAAKFNGWFHDLYAALGTAYAVDAQSKEAAARYFSLAYGRTLARIQLYKATEQWWLANIERNRYANEISAFITNFGDTLVPDSKLELIQSTPKARLAPRINKWRGGLHAMYAELDAISDPEQYLRWRGKVAEHLGVSSQALGVYLTTGNPGNNRVLRDLPEILKINPNVVTQQRFALLARIERWRKNQLRDIKKL